MSKFVTDILPSRKKKIDPSERIDDEDAWTIIESFILEHGFIHHQLSSYNKFLENIRDIISQNRRIVVKKKGARTTRYVGNDETIIGDYIVEFGEVKLLPPSHKEINDKVRIIYPKECNDRNISYSSQLLIDINFTTPHKPTLHKNQYVGSIPVMVMSELCNLYKIRHDKASMAEKEEDIHERGGFFIINGSPKVVLTQERSAFNRAYVFAGHKYKPKFDLYTEVRSFSSTGNRQTTAKVGIFTKTLAISVCIPYIDGISIPLGVMFRALGAKTKEEMIKYIISDDSDEELKELLVPSLEQSWLCDNHNMALHYIGKKGKKFTSAPIMTGNATTIAKKQKKTAIRKFIKKVKSFADSERNDFIIKWTEDEEGLILTPDPLHEMVNILDNSTPFEEQVESINSLINRLVSEKIRDEAISYAKHLLSIEFLPHVGIGEESFVRKRFFLGYMVKKLLFDHCGRESHADRDHYQNKRNATAGVMLSSLFSTIFKKFTMDIASYIEKCIEADKPINILSSIRYNTITDGMSNALSSDAWGGRGKKAPGTSQQFDRFNYLAGLTHSRRLVTPISSEGGKVEPPRKLHNSHWHVACPSETPEGKKAGLVKNIAISALITTGADPHALIKLMESLDIVPFSEVIKDPKLLDLDKVFVNGDMRGVTSYPDDVIFGLREIRRSGGLNPETSLSYNRSTREIHISTESGRLYRPMLIVSNGEILLNHSRIEYMKENWDEEAGSYWSMLLREGYIELIDKLEEDELLISASPSRFYKLSEEERKLITHCELNPSLMYGVGASLVPFPDHNQSPRVTYQAAMGKQGVGRLPPNHIFMTKGTFYCLAYPQKPILLTRVGKLIGFQNFPSSQNAVVAICPWYGYGQEDSLIGNQSSFDRGFGKTYAYISFEATVRREKNEKFEVPTDKDCSNFKGNPNKLDPITGIIPEGTIVEQGDHLIGRTIVSDNTHSVHSHSKENISIIYNERLPGKVHLVRHGKSRKKDDDDEGEEDWRSLPDGKGYDYVRIVVVQERSPIEGDKFSGCHGQKGTIGKAMISVDLPFTEEGITPDIIINPLAFPSRMTIGMLIEMIKGILRCSGAAVNNVAFDKAMGNIFDLDKENGDPSNGLDEKQKMKRTKYSTFKADDDCSPFDLNFSLTRICQELKKLGYNQFSDRVMTNGQTGDTMKALIFVGVCCYQRLKHMVINKVHARSRGGRTRMTRQPKEGRQLGGGLKNGVMEKDVLLGSGVSLLVKDRLMEQSDPSAFWYCRKCGLQALSILDPLTKKSRVECRVCSTRDVALVKIPYATKLLTQELSAMNIVPRILTTKYHK